MNYQAHKYPYLKSTSTNLARQSFDSLRPNSPINNTRYLACTNSPHRPNSPNHLKVKIRLVSPHRMLDASSFLRKQNTPPLQIAQSQRYRQCLKSTQRAVFCSRPDPMNCIAEVKLNEQSNISIANHFEKQSRSTSPMHSLFKTTLIHDSTPNRQLDQSFQPFSHRAEVNNASFDLSNKKSIIYGNPMNQKRGSWNKVNRMQVQRRVQTEQSAAYDYCHPSVNMNDLHSDLFIQEQDNLQNFKLTYEQDIKTPVMQSNIQQDNEVKPLLRQNRLSKHTSIAAEVQQYRFVDDPQSKEKIANKQEIGIQYIPTNKVPVCSQQTIINELNILTSKKIERQNQQQKLVNKDSISANGEIETNKLQSKKINRLRLTRNEDCCIQMVMRARPTLLQNQQTVNIVPSLKQSKAIDKSKAEKELNVCSQHSLQYLPSTQQKKIEEECAILQTAHNAIDEITPALHQSIHNDVQKSSQSLQSIASEKNDSQKSISVKSKESKAGSIVSQKIKPKEQKTQIIPQEKITESIKNSLLAQAHLPISKNSPPKKYTPFIYSVPALKPKIQIGRGLALQGGQSVTTAPRKFNNRAYL